MRHIIRPTSGRRVLALAILICAAAWSPLDPPVARGEAAADDRSIVVVLHGLGRSKAAMWLLARRLEDAGYWVARVGYHSLRHTPDQILADIGRQIEACCLGRSRKVHFVGHSLGGLLIRAYLTDRRVANLGRVVLIGTPNTGTEIIDNLRHKWWFKVLGPMAQQLGTDDNSFPRTIGPPDYPLGVIAGKTARSANEALLPGDDDGLVTVDSTRVDGMTDFVVMETTHAAMRYDRDVADQVVRFLITGAFDKGAD